MTIKLWFFEYKSGEYGPCIERLNIDVTMRLKFVGLYLKSL